VRTGRLAIAHCKARHAALAKSGSGSKKSGKLKGLTMKTNLLDGKFAADFRKGVLAGIAVLTSQIKRAEEIVAKLDAPGELTVLKGSRYAVYGAMSNEGLDALSALEVALGGAKVGYCLCIQVPTKELQTEIQLVDGVAKRTFCSSNGLPIRAVDNGKNIQFTRPTFWVITAELSSEGAKYMAQLFGQYKQDGVLTYSPMRKGGTNEGELIVKEVDSEDTLIAETGVAESFLMAMIRPLKDAIKRVEGASRLRRAVGGGLRVSLGEAQQNHSR